MDYQDYQRELDLQLERLKIVDRVLADPVLSLIKVYDDWSRQTEPKKFKTVPTYITAEHGNPSPALLIHAMTCSTLQRIARHQHRFPWLKDKKDKEFLKTLNEHVAKFFVKEGKFDESKPLEFIKEFNDHIFGALNPFVATEIFRVLINSGERNAHGGAGFLALFSIFWSLHRRWPDPTKAGARLDPWQPTASVTAKCLTLINDLYKIITRRKTLYIEMSKALSTIAENAGKPAQQQRWQVVVNIERLAGTMHWLSTVASYGAACLEASHDIAALTANVGPDTPTEPLWREVAARVREVLLDLETTNNTVLHEADVITRKLLNPIVEMTGNETGRAELKKHYCNQFDVIQVHAEHFTNHWADVQQAAKRAQKDAEEALGCLKKGIEACKPLHEHGQSDATAFKNVLKGLVAANECVAKTLKEAVKENVAWMPVVISQHVAFASAGNLTHFDPAEMLSAIGVVERWSHDFTDAEAADAIKKAIDAGQRGDGSFSATQPVFLVKRVHGVWPSAADIGWLLARAAREKQDITTADEALMLFVRWLERNRIDRPGDPNRSGWATDTREEEVMDTWATCSGINALLDIRAIVEHRLWQLCEKRFLVRTEDDLMDLDKIDPVDLGLTHKHRLHQRLARMARETAVQHDENPKAVLRPKDERRHHGPNEYAFVLHGPPGSSKTVIAEALGKAMWGGKDPRFVRITPADFTRGGEEGLDREARFIFDLLSHVRRVTIFFDEIDDLLRLRAGGGDVNFLKLIVPAMLNRLQDLHDAASRQEICFLLATNYIDNIEPALTRPGRIDAVLPVPYPDAWSREAIIERIFKERQIPEDVKKVAVTESAGWPWSTYRKLCNRLASMKPLTAEQTILEMEELTGEFENSDFYYFDPQRWRRPSRPLMKEFIRVAFALSKDRQTSRRKVEELLLELKQGNVQLGRLPFEAAFDAEWERTH
jgi:hypothetical protein